MKHFTLSAGLLLVLTTALSGADWPRFRGLDGNASFPSANVPLTWSDTENIRWKTEIPGNGSSSPSVFADRIYLTSFSDYAVDPDDFGDRSKLTLRVLCFDRRDGKLIWDKSFPAAEAEQKATRRVADHGYATGTVVCDEHGVYAYFGVTGMVAFDHEGNRLWTAATGEKTAGFGSAASPILYRDLVIINASIEAETVFAFDRATGKEAWRIEDVQKSWTTPIVGQSADGRDELVVSYKERIRGFNPLTGEELWTCRGVQDYVVPCVVVNDGIAYVLGGRKNQSMAVRLGGSGDVSETHTLWSNSTGANVTSPVYHEGKLYWSSDRGIANAMDATTGDTIFQQRMATRERVYASAVLAGNRLYLTTRENGVLVIAVDDEYRVLAHNIISSDDSLWNATPAVMDDCLLFRTNNFLYCIGE